MFFLPDTWRGATPHAPPSRRQAQVRGPLPVCRCRHWNILALTNPIEWRGCVDGMFVCSPRHLARGDPARPTLTPSSTGQGSLARLSMSPLEYTCIDYPHRVERVRRRHVCFFSPTPGAGDPARPTLTPSSTGQGSLARLSMSPLEYTCIDYPHRVERVRRRHVCFFSPTPAWRGSPHPHAVKHRSGVPCPFVDVAIGIYLY